MMADIFSHKGKRMDLEAIYDAMNARLEGPGELYDRLNALRDWVNQNLSGFELYLEDAWNERTPGETHFEYILRSLKTLNETSVIGYDRYANHQDSKGVWHLDDYIDSVRLMDSPQPLVDFILANR